MKRKKYEGGGSVEGLGPLMQGGTSFLTQVFSLIETLGTDNSYNNQPVVSERQTAAYNPYSRDFGSNNLPKFSLGGEAGEVPIEIEGGEVMETPNGQVAKAQGPSHSEGGIDVNVPKGTDIYSDRISIDGKTMAQRKESRAKTLKRLEKLLAKNPGDKLLKNTLSRTSEVNDMEDAQDMELQNVIKKATNQNQRETFAGGGTVGKKYNGFFDNEQDNYFPIDNNILPTIMGGSVLPAVAGDNIHPTGAIDVAPTNPTASKVAVGNNQNSPGDSFTTGDYVGIAGNLFNALAPLMNTMDNRAGDTPNINAYKNFGKDSLDANEEAKGYVKGQRENALRDLKIQKNSAKLANRDNAKSVNTVRALDAVTDMGYNSGMNAIYDSFSKQMMGNLSEQAQLENQQDQYVMGGEQARDLADRQDRDNFYTQKGQDLVNLGNNVTGLGKNLNIQQENSDVIDLMGQLSKYGLNFTRDKNGKLVLSK